MEMCRTCLKTPARKHIFELEKDIKDDRKSSFHIMLFCLNIEVTEDSKVTTNLCSNCYKKIISFYKFKAMSQKNDAYLKSLDSVVLLEDQKVCVFVNENGIKHENFIDPNVFVPSIEQECNLELKIELDGKEHGALDDCEINFKNEDTFNDIESGEEPLRIVPKIHYENTKHHSEGHAPAKKQRGRPKKGMSQTENKSKDDRHVCEECGKSVRNLRKHSVRHKKKSERPLLKCELCPKQFISTTGRRTHYRNIHLGLSKFGKSVCDICNKEVKYLKTHKMMMHNQETLPYGCVSCDRRYPSHSALIAHMAKHMGEADLPYECDICQRRFRVKSLVSNHIRQYHQGEKNYQCEFCSKTFFAKGAFNQHFGTHAKERLYKCPECGLYLKTKETLSKHRMIHSDVRKFKCKLCTKSFKKSEYLSLHMVTHTKEKRYECQYCGVRFGRSSHRRRHEATVHTKNLKIE